MTSGTRSVWPARLFVVAMAALSLLPLARLAANWIEWVGVLGIPLQATPPRGYDGVRWVDDGAIVAEYVFPKGPGHAAGLRAGDTLARLGYDPVFAAGDVEARVERATGTVQSYQVVRDGRMVSADVAIAEYPPFLYPLSQRLWTAATWGFVLAVFVHVLALLTVLPLARRSRRARRSAVLIGVALLWVGGTLLRLLWVTLVGTPGSSGPLAEGLFDALTLVALTGWTLFPALLLRQSLVGDRLTRLLTRPVRPLLFVPPAVLGGGVAIATVRGHVGPLPPDAFVPPILYYVCVYVAASTLVALVRPPTEAEDGMRVPGWSRAGSAFVGVVAALGALFAYNALPGFRGEQDLAGAWFVTALQLLSLLPVSLVSLATLRYGRFDVWFVRGLRLLAGYGGLFVLVAGGEAVLRTLVPERTSPLWLGGVVVAAVGMAQALASPLRRWVASTFPTERQRARRRLDRFSERARFILDAEHLAAEAVATVGDALGPRSAVVYVRSGIGTADERWVRASYRPESPAFTDSDLDRVWTRLRHGDEVWARNDELNESDLPVADSDRLRALGVALAVPVSDRTGEPAGLIVLTRRARRLAVYDVEDVDRLRALAAAFALALERLRLIDRERELVRQTAEAEFAALRAQINPHFLFNALNTVAALIHERPDQAESTVESLAGLFRDVLTASGRTTVSLADELRLVRRYLDVEKARFGDALEVEVEASDDALAREIPAFAVQTLVENAVKHGIERKRGGGAVRIQARVEDDGRLAVRVEDTGAGIPVLYSPGGDGLQVDPPADEPGDLPSYYGVGLSNVARRLQQVYGDGDRLRLTSGPGGTVARLLLPP